MSNFKHWNISKAGMAFDPQTGESFQLNDTAKFLLELLRQGKTAEEAAAEMAKHFNISYEQALTETLEFQVQLEMMSAA